MGVPAPPPPLPLCPRLYADWVNTAKQSNEMGEGFELNFSTLGGIIQ